MNESCYLVWCVLNTEPRKSIAPLLSGEKAVCQHLHAKPPASYRTPAPYSPSKLHSELWKHRALEVQHRHIGFLSDALEHLVSENFKMKNCCLHRLNSFTPDQHIQ